MREVCSGNRQKYVRRSCASSLGDMCIFFRRLHTTLVGAERRCVRRSPHSCVMSCSTSARSGRILIAQIQCVTACTGLHLSPNLNLNGVRAFLLQPNRLQMATTSQADEFAEVLGAWDESLSSTAFFLLLFLPRCPIGLRPHSTNLHHTHERRIKAFGEHVRSHQSSSYFLLSSLRSSTFVICQERRRKSLWQNSAQRICLGW